MSSPQNQIVVTGGFDDLSSRHVRFLEEASRLGPVTVLLWPDETLEKIAGRTPRFNLPERCYLVQGLRYVHRVLPLNAPIDLNELPPLPDLQPVLWLDLAEPDSPAARAGIDQNARSRWCRQHGAEYRLLAPDQLKGFPEAPLAPSSPGRKKVIVTGCYDWLHSGHVRFFEEVSSYGDLYVIVGHDANIRLLKGEGHPLLPQDERRYLAGSVRFVTQALVSSGDGWLDAEPEIQRLKPDIYAVNEDGDKGGKREFCKAHGLEYLVLRRIPAPGLPARSSTNLRGF